MKDPILPELKKLRKQVENLKKEKERKLSLATSIKERNKLMMEIQELEAVIKAPSKLKSFAKTFFRGSNIVRRTLWRGIKGASRNLDRNAPEFRELSKGMTKRPMRPTSPLMEIYSPSSPQYKRAPIKKMKTRKIKKGKKKTVRKRQKRMEPMGIKPMKKGYDSQVWDLP